MSLSQGSSTVSALTTQEYFQYTDFKYETYYALKRISQQRDGFDSKDDSEDEDLEISKDSVADVRSLST